MHTITPGMTPREARQAYDNHLITFGTLYHIICEYLYNQKKGTTA